MLQGYLKLICGLLEHLLLSFVKPLSDHLFLLLIHLLIIFYHCRTTDSADID